MGDRTAQVCQKNLQRGGRPALPLRHDLPQGVEAETRASDSGVPTPQNLHLARCPTLGPSAEGPCFSFYAVGGLEPVLDSVFIWDRSRNR